MKRKLTTRGLAAGALTAIALTTACSTSNGSGGANTAANAKQVSALPAGFTLSGAPNTPQAQPLAKHASLKVGIPSKLELEAPALLANEKGEFRKENLSVTFVTDTVPNLLTLLGQNKIDLVYAGAQALVFNALKNNIPIRWVSGVASSAPESGIFVSTKLGSQSSFHASDLKGKNIGVNPGALAAPSEYGLYQLLAKGGLKAADVTMTAFNDPGAMVQALNSGSIQAATLGPPYTAALTAGGSFLAQPTYPSTIQIAGYFSTTSLLDANRAAGVAFFRALERTINTYFSGDYHKNASVMADVAKLLGSTVAKLRTAPSTPFDLDVPAASVPALQQMYRSVPDTLQYSGTIKASQLIDLSLVIDAARGKVS